MAVRGEICFIVFGFVVWESFGHVEVLEFHGVVATYFILDGLYIIDEIIKSVIVILDHIFLPIPFLFVFLFELDFLKEVDLLFQNIIDK